MVEGLDKESKPTSYEETVRRTDFMKRFESVYAGPYPASEALWWYWNPMSASPGGVESPYSTRPGLEMQVFASVVPNHAAQKALFIINTDEELARFEVRKALDWAQQATVFLTDSEKPVTESANQVARSKNLLLARAAIACILLIIGGAFGFGVSQVTKSQDTFVADRSLAKPSETPMRPSPIDDLFAREQRPGDIVSGDLPSNMVSTSLRRLADSKDLEPIIGEKTNFQVFAGLERSKLTSSQSPVCLILITDASVKSFRCADRPVFEKQGLTIGSIEGAIGVMVSFGKDAALSVEPVATSD